MDQTAQNLISRSVSHNEIARAEYSYSLATDLAAMSDDGVITDGVVEYWGTTASGAEWRVHLTTNVARAERVVRDLARQDSAGEVDDSYARTGDAKDTVERWMAAGGEAGDEGVCDAIGLLGVTRAAQVYEAAREALAARVPS